jgi:hypothetical protein
MTKINRTVFKLEVIPAAAKLEVSLAVAKLEVNPACPQPGVTPAIAQPEVTPAVTPAVAKPEATQFVEQEIQLCDTRSNSICCRFGAWDQSPMRLKREKILSPGIRLFLLKHFPRLFSSHLPSCLTTSPVFFSLLPSFLLTLLFSPFVSSFVTTCPLL